MSTNPYSFVLNQIRLGKGQVRSYQNAIKRFGNVDPDKVYRQWLAAWAGKYTADLWVNNPNDPLKNFLQSGSSSRKLPGINASTNVIQSWISSATDGPYDFVMTYRIVTRAQKNYGQWSYQLGENDTYTMALSTATDTLIKEYIRKSDGKVESVRHWIVANTVRM